MYGCIELSSEDVGVHPGPYDDTLAVLPSGIGPILYRFLNSSGTPTTAASASPPWNCCRTTRPESDDRSNERPISCATGTITGTSAFTARAVLSAILLLASVCAEPYFSLPRLPPESRLKSEALPSNARVSLPLYARHVTVQECCGPGGAVGLLCRAVLRLCVACLLCSSLLLSD